jgi:2-polyprenyl-3-methyl-5-hydroxy-6-metoxy-1,4-benzoquinol methylase
MLTLSQKINYFLNASLRIWENPVCPHCKSENHTQVDSKFLFTRLLDCQDCRLLYRFPSCNAESNRKFYQTDYVEDDSITTELPSEGHLKKLIVKNFTDGEKNADRYIKLFRALYSGNENKVKIIDYGSSWGYISYQLKQAGFDVQSFEISKPRLQYGNKNLGLDITNDQDELRGDNDIFFSSHVIEHLPDIFSFIELAKKLIRSGGYFISISPNGSEDYKNSDPKGFHSCWGKVHPNYLNSNFYKKKFQDYPYYIGSTPFDLVGLDELENGKQIIGNLSGGELYVIVKL